MLSFAQGCTAQPQVKQEDHTPIASDNHENSIAIPKLEVLTKKFDAQDSTIEIVKPSSLDIYVNHDSYAVTPIRYEPRKSLLRNSFQCGLVIQQNDIDPQYVITIGEGITEALSCDEFVELGPVLLSGSQYLIGIYNVHSPNTELSTAVALSLNPKSGEWYVNEEVSEKLHEYGPIRSLAELADNKSLQ